VVIVNRIIREWSCRASVRMAERVLFQPRIPARAAGQPVGRAASNPAAAQDVYSYSVSHILFRVSERKMPLLRHPAGRSGGLPGPSSSGVTTSAPNVTTAVGSSQAKAWARRRPRTPCPGPTPPVLAVWKRAKFTKAPQASISGPANKTDSVTALPAIDSATTRPDLAPRHTTGSGVGDRRTARRRQSPSGH